ncbi:Sialidase-3 [Nibea albiflora]|uniref:Sialidase-3 n=1 Tax=Nibea albiflora TaxID=240163 RepID=A0ACB7F164_NIBAL|nr:Sialidase-3 [Nibea albiflora]
MGNRASKSSGEEAEPLKTTLFEREPCGTTYRIPALIYLRHRHTFLAFAEKRASSADRDAKVLVMRQGALQRDGTVQVDAVRSSAAVHGDSSGPPYDEPVSRL